MRFAAVFTSASLLSSVSATYYQRQIPGFPSCANTCISAPTNLGGCQPTDEGCLCKSLPFIQTTLACIMNACQGADQQSAISGAEGLCLNFGVTLSAESSAIAAGISTAVGASTTASGSGQVTSAGSSTAPSPTASPNSARSLFSGYVLGAIVVGCVTAALSL
ncbi:hypothetical protein C8R44DRAFT_155046 [Mycena epipterygia]|nr:hypothetical protein C8R44DRAFT_155046 [Mycena epipterygia]